MVGDEIRCEGCGVRFRPTPTRQGPRARYHSPACRKSSWKMRRHFERATETADLALSSTHARLADALSVLTPSALMSVRRFLAGGVLSPEGGDGLCTRPTPSGGSVWPDYTPKEP